MSERVRERVSEWVRQPGCGRLSKQAHDWVNEWVSVSLRVKLPIRDGRSRQLGVKTERQWLLIERFSFAFQLLLTQRPRAYWENVRLTSPRKWERWMIRRGEDDTCRFPSLVPPSTPSPPQSSDLGLIFLQLLKNLSCYLSHLLNTGNGNSL